ncbi:twin-arginine translocase TatA/TatE family subunit [Deinococcus rubellus]|uniref:Sec-independent protein translocase protein TatA n=2 Tax=Deinococcus rubellus TaxID=1889240 RepID=A0ABY5YKR9_9DEIO|nr:twin-arginine translocase TatA/TatE family subunit [Deinococcus rubellus]
MGILEPGHLLLILLAALLIFGPRKLPELGKTLGQTLREFRQHTSGLSAELSGSLDTPQIGAQSLPAAATVPVERVAAETVQLVATTPVPVAEHAPIKE